MTGSPDVDFSPTWSPDGKQVAALRIAEGRRPRIAAITAASRRARTVERLPAAVFGGELSWSAQDDAHRRNTPSMNTTVIGPLSPLVRETP